ncbi:SPRY domain-containing SOCS box protein 3 [Tribolium castaneum]|uniref:SPRY domain-containing SOCS box protein 3-like Protein n=1 Tax=Tribolium castaneum TaxID=7070 RepID=D6WXY3_TRICA|nr:PREDICTED: SPRY domain-containing SOCS box protein 3 [Tribolium castaneum]EFA08917.1 SPRY domain-containing SOCS box protein 3-like Protein [Tribolium castaneum]|eukprot:XP_966919.1 PREDICTED: SPRY domain-containing SOCS box protein 3 [Tribolium castaneum]
MDPGRVKFSYLNPYCTEKCVNNLADGKLQCDCADSGIYNWIWEKQDDTCALLSKNNREVTFHPVYSSGTAALRGSKPLEKNRHHFWEMKMLSNLYGTDVMVGVGTSEITLADWRYRFFSLLGFDKESWGYSYNGLVQHDNVTRCYGSKFGLGSLIGVHLDMYNGTLEYYFNRKPLGVAFQGLKSHKLYPMISSTAAQSAMKMTCAISIESSLQLTCLQCIIKHPELYKQFKSIPGLAKIYEHNFFWMLPKEYEDPKRKAKENIWSSKRRKMLIPIKWPRCLDSEQQTLKISLHFTNYSDSESSCDMNYDGSGDASTSKEV